MIKWSIDLSEYILEFRPRKSIKAYALANFVAECPFYYSQSEDQASQLAAGSTSCQVTIEVDLDLWLVYVDGLLAQEGAGAGMSLIGLDKEEFRYFVKFMFPITNNATEYEALLVGPRLAKKICVEKLTVFVDSQLVVR